MRLRNPTPALKTPGDTREGEGGRVAGGDPTTSEA
jgi:hypothetical protein